MGLLSLGTPLTWEEAKPHADLVRERGIEQLLNIWKKAKSKERDILLWGDEVTSNFLFLHFPMFLTVPPRVFQPRTCTNLESENE
ncbi:hypothetical protein AOL_s00075g212 [Orbilia oligospora ATCC 24927]|uniref:Glutamate--cysteine ligase n=1 Tax=Arthrobotrys oligospora (strain ATCC 24927 / CBS 115.81 / DSM 1491) TaxID=756982 RepID=G1X8L3_ARTOA|nr:hypothetical protein AOL_s00075g212 [Orbilia oligospora ATCC 24927]EGX50483.1 hypothetical protein AOL_s00075g212 [Orbilia oligospora ATCC 24927]